MKRILKLFALLLVLIVGTVVVIGVVSFGGMAPVIDGRELGSALTVNDGYVASYLIDTGDGALLIDSGNEVSADPIIAALAKKNRRPEDVKAIFITHGHADHLAGIAKFPRAAIYALEREVPIAEGRETTHGILLKIIGASPHPVKVTHPLTDGSSVAVGNKVVEVFAIPGHTAGSAAYLVDGALFVGDSASLRDNGAVEPGPWPVTDDQDQNRASMRALAVKLAPRSEEIKWVVPAHTGPIEGLKALETIQ